MTFQNCETSEDVGSNDEIVVGFVLNHVANAHEFGVVNYILELTLAIVRREINPTDHPRNIRVTLSEPECPLVFERIVLGLNHDGSVDPARFEERFEIVRKKIAPDGGEWGGVEPRVVEGGGELPEVVVSVDGGRHGGILERGLSDGLAGECHGESRATPGSGRYFDSSSVQLDEPLHNIESKPDPTLAILKFA